MKLVKLNRRHKFHQYGYTYGFVGSSSDEQRFRIEQYLESVYGHHQYDNRSSWYSGFSGSRSKMTDIHYSTYDNVPKEFSYYGRTYWICVRNEADITAALLAMG